MNTENSEMVGNLLAQLLPSEISEKEVADFVSNKAAKAVYYIKLLELLLRIDDKRQALEILVEAKVYAQLINLSNKHTASNQNFNVEI